MDKIYKKILNGTVTFKQYWKGQPIVRYGQEVGPEPSPYAEPFYVENVSDDVMTLVITNSRYYTSYPNVEKSTDKINWETVGIPAYNSPLNISIPVGGKLYLRSKVSYWGPSRSNGGPAYMYSTSDYNVGGNIMSLLQGSDFTGMEGVLTSTNNNAFYGLFNNSGNKLIDASKLLLPSNTSVSCYQFMFQNCDSLMATPVLPATSLSSNCYNGMFSRCGSLIVAPSLPATTLVEGCYKQMFFQCVSLNSIECLATDISATDCVYRWVYYVSGSGTFTKASSMTSWGTGESGIPSGWTIVDK